MKQEDIIGIIPEHYTGKKTEAEASVTLHNTEEAIIFYKTVKERLLDVNKWHEVAGIISARFYAVDNNGNEVDRKVHKGDYMKIDIPGPGSKEGDGYDWVKIEELKEASEGDIQSVGFRVRPSENPQGDKKNIAHFYDDSATSNFIVTREGTIITASVIDRNLKPNKDTESLTDKLRHSAVGAGAIGIFSKIQWQNLVEGLVKREK
ncbi:MAG TPA: hypothetical protein VH396_12910 [Chitinophagaceae bacterium]|jgi:hypothetical protein